jgi:hypothetical protein
VDLSVPSTLDLRYSPQIIHTRPYFVGFALLAWTYLALAIPLRLLRRHPLSLISSPDASRQKLFTLLCLYALSWISLLAGTIIRTGSAYPLTALNACVLLATVLELGAKTIRTKSAKKAVFTPRIDIRSPGGEYIRDPEVNSHASDHAEPEEAPSERTPLIRDDNTEHDFPDSYSGVRPTHARPASEQNRHANAQQGEEAAHEVGWWIGELLLLVPVPVMLVGHILVLVLDAMSQTLVDGGGVSGGESSTSQNHLRIKLKNDSLRDSRRHPSSHPFASRAIRTPPTFFAYHRNRHFCYWVNNLYMACLPVHSRSTF